MPGPCWLGPSRWARWRRIRRGAPVAVALRAVMRRSGQPVAIHTALPLAFVFLGAGYSNILSGVQTTFNLSVVFGLTHLLVVTRDPPTVRRDLLGLAAGAAALMCSGIGPVMVVPLNEFRSVRTGIMNSPRGAGALHPRRKGRGEVPPPRWRAVPGELISRNEGMRRC